jgi:elongation factor G
MSFPEPVISISIEPKSRADQEKLLESLTRLAEEDPTFKVTTNEETGQTIISGMGELHLEVLTERLLREFQVRANVGTPWVSYKETVTRKQSGEGKFIRQSGGRGHYGHVVLTVEPLTDGTVFAFENRLEGDVIPRVFIPAIEKGIREAMQNGVIAGGAMIGVKVTLTGGSSHEVDSTELAFKVAATMAVRDAVEKAHPVLLEPVMKVEVLAPEEYAGTVMNDLNGRRAHITGIEPRKKTQAIMARVPLAEMFGYATKLRNLSQGRAVFTMEFSSYEPVPDEVLTRMRIGIVN